MPVKYYKPTTIFPKKNIHMLIYLQAPNCIQGVLKAAGYLFLDKRIEKIIILSQQEKYPKEIIGYQGTNPNQFLIRWHTIKNNSWIYTQIQNNIPQEVFDQLLYCVLTNQIKQVTCLGIGSDISKKTIKDKLNEITYPDCWVIMLWSTTKTWSHSKKEDSKVVQHLLNKKIYQEQKSRFWNYYISLIKQRKLAPELVAYVHSSDLWVKNIQQIWYICAVA
jgi:hypothetical protein